MSNLFYNSSGTPGQRSPGDSAALRAEFAAIAAGFDLVAEALDLNTSGGFITSAAVAAGYVPKTGDSILTGNLTVRSNIGGLNAQHVAPNGLAGFTTYDQNGAAQIELLHIGSTHAGMYGVAAGGSVLNVSSAAGFTMSMGGIARFGFTPTGDMSAVGSLYANGVNANSAVIGTITGNVTGSVSGSSGSCTGNAASATVAGTASYATAAGSAASASSVPWIGVTGRPTSLSNFTNDPGYVTAPSSGSNGYGSRTVSTAGPSGGVDGDLWYVIP